MRSGQKQAVGPGLQGENRQQASVQGRQRNTRARSHQVRHQAQGHRPGSGPNRPEMEGHEISRKEMNRAQAQVKVTQAGGQVEIQFQGPSPGSV
jgi:hypothetical protein